jgi:hypothetical protein
MGIVNLEEKGARESSFAGQLIDEGVSCARLTLNWQICA